MTRTIVIDPVTRLEGHAKITLRRDTPMLPSQGGEGMMPPKHQQRFITCTVVAAAFGLVSPSRTPPRSTACKLYRNPADQRQRSIPTIHCTHLQ